MSPLAAWSVLIIGFVLPLVHVAITPSLRRPDTGEKGRCPFSPRMGWIVLVLFLGPIGWLMFIGSRRRKT